MKTLVIKLVAVFEIICGLGGWMMVLGGLVGAYPYEPVPVLWYGLFPLLSLVAGIMLLLNIRNAYQLSVITLALQIPFIYIAGMTFLRVGLAFNMYLTATWYARGSEPGPTVLGFNALALVVLIALVMSRSALQAEEQSSDPPAPPDFTSTTHGGQ